MTDWTKPALLSYEYYTVDPLTWRDRSRLLDVTSASLKRDTTSPTRGSATFEVTDDLGECYVRVYLVAVQNGARERVQLGTYLVQTPRSASDGKVTRYSLEAYTPLIELKEKQPPLGYSLLKGDNVMKAVCGLARESLRAPVVACSSGDSLRSDFVANTSDTWLSFLSDLAANAKRRIDLDESSRVIFPPNQEVAALQPVWTYADDNSSILYSESSVERDLFGIPNAVQVVYSDGTDHFEAWAVNDDPASPTSTVARGRTISYRETSPNLGGVPSREQVEEYAQLLLEQLSSVEYTVTYSHGYCPVRPGDCVRLDYRRAGLRGVKARVVSQDIKCTPECPVSETATFTTKTYTRR